MSATFSWEDIKKHNTASGAWVVIEGAVYDVTAFLAEHPGGDDILLEHAGKDATNDFKDIGHSRSAVEMLANYKIGTVQN